jgi:hypothetical protein
VPRSQNRLAVVAAAASLRDGAHAERVRQPQPELAAAFAAQGVDIGRAFPPLLGWARISIGLPEENARAQVVLRRVLAG